jgi:hypothetical protein
VNPEIERQLREVATTAWEGEVRWPDIVAWSENFDGSVLGNPEEERDYAGHALTRFVYFSRRLVRELLRSAYRDMFESPVLQRLRRNLRDTKDIALLRREYNSELMATRFVGVGNPAESGAIFRRTYSRTFPLYLFLTLRTDKPANLHIR